MKYCFQKVTYTPTERRSVFFIFYFVSLPQKTFYLSKFFKQTAFCIFEKHKIKLMN